MKLDHVQFRDLIGYTEVEWPRLRPGMNLLLGENGVGKSTVLQGIACALTYLAGMHTEDAFVRTHPNATVNIEISGGAASKVYDFRFGDVHTAHVTSPRLALKVLYIGENRQPKNVTGKYRSNPDHHWSQKYPNAVSELQHLMEEDAELAAEILQCCREVTDDSTPWDELERMLPHIGQRKARPISCGLFDILALTLEIVRLTRSLGADTSLFVLIDNPETYLHPALHERVIGLILGKFPEAQLFLASHSLKLLCHQDSSSVYWLRRDGPSATITSVREMDGGVRDTFLCLYGFDVNSAVLRLLGEFEQPTYREFLLQCALPSASVRRKDPSTDRQMIALTGQIAEVPTTNILDFGAGDGDLVIAIHSLLHELAPVVYTAVDHNPSPLLRERIREYVQKGTLGPQSRILTKLDVPAPPERLDAAILCNLCHEVGPTELPWLLACLVARLRLGGRLVIHELDVLPKGESHFIMWTPDDYAEMFRDVEGIEVTVPTSSAGGGGCPSRGIELHTTVLNRCGEDVTNIEWHLRYRIFEMLPAKGSKCLRELKELYEQAGTLEGMKEVFRQRRVAFLLAQYAHIAMALDSRPSSVGQTSDGETSC